MLCGGSHFLRRSFFQNRVGPFFPLKYGYEEMLPSLVIADAGFYNAVAPSLLVIHNPSVDKWKFSDKNNEDVLILEMANQKGLKSLLYPKWSYPLICAVYELRCLRYLNKVQKRKSNEKVRALTNLGLGYSRIHSMTLVKLVSKYGFSIF